MFSSKSAIVNQNQVEGNPLDTAMNTLDHTMEYLLAAQAMQAVVRVKYSPHTHG